MLISACSCSNLSAYIAFCLISFLSFVSCLPYCLSLNIESYLDAIVASLLFLSQSDGWKRGAHKGSCLFFCGTYMPVSSSSSSVLISNSLIESRLACCKSNTLVQESGMSGRPRFDVVLLNDNANSPSSRLSFYSSPPESSLLLLICFDFILVKRYQFNINCFLNAAIKYLIIGYVSAWFDLI